MRLHWYGHAAFLVESSDGRRVIIDPYDSSGYGDSFRLAPIDESAHVVLASHSHTDHFDPRAVAGGPVIITEPGVHDVIGIRFVGTETLHDAQGGRERGINVVWRFKVDGMTCVHLGDLGHELDDVQAGSIGTADVLMVPVGGTFTIDASGARTVVERLAARVVVPMHFKTDKVAFPMDGVDAFLQGPEPVSRVGGPDLVLEAGELPDTRSIHLLEPSR